MNDNSFSSQSIRTYRRKKNVGGTIASILIILILLAIAAVLAMVIAKIGPFAPVEGGVTESDTTDTTDSLTEDAPDTSETTSGTEAPPETTEPPETADPNAIIYVSVNKSQTDIGIGDLVLIDKTHPYSFPETTLYSLYEYKATGSYKIATSTLYLRYEALLHFESMTDALVEATKKTVTDEEGLETTIYFDDVQITVAYRDYETQEVLYQNNPKNAAAPGCSDYHSGSTIYINRYTDSGSTEDLNLSSESQWIKQNAHKYGFIFRFPTNKHKITGYNIPWQMRYVGIAHATYMYQNNLCLEEYLQLLSDNHRYLSNHLQVNAADGMTYEIFYVQGPEEGVLKLPIPANRDYTVSGDNIGGFIVTVTVGPTETSESDT